MSLRPFYIQNLVSFFSENGVISQMNLKEKNLVGAKDESSVVEMSQQEFLELLRKNGYLNQEIPINQALVQDLRSFFDVWAQELHPTDLL